MSDTTLIIVVLVAAIGGLAGIAYLLDRRRSAGSNEVEGDALGPVGRVYQILRITGK